jgi:TM2 domain-containing membrane protein YozV
MQYFPNIDAEEMAMLQSLTADLDQTQLQNFVTMYSARRKDSQTILLTCLLGFIGIAGIHRFILDEIGMGILYLLTGGLCAIGTIVDLVNYRHLTLECNQKAAYLTVALVKGGMVANPPVYPKM